MKKLVVLMMFLVACFASKAQGDEQVSLRVVKKSEEPQAVLDAVKKDFPGAISRNLSFLPAKNYGQEWTVESNKASSDVNINYYQVDIRTDDSYETAVYDKAGKLLRVKQVVKNGKLPDEVKSTVSKFDGWQMIGNEEEIANDKKFTIFYKVRLKKGLLRKTLFLDPTGQIKKDLAI